MLSLIVPTYQAERHLPRLLTSLDSAPSWEIVIVDDGSTDDTVRIASEWLSSRQSGSLVKLAHRGPGHARQIGLERASNAFVTFADADDEVVAVVLDSATNLLESVRGDVAIASFETAPRTTSAVIPVPRHARRVPSRRVLTSRAAIWGKVYRRQFLQDHSISFPPLRSADDVVFSWRTAAKDPKTYELSSVGYRYWVDPHGQLTRDPRYFIEGIDSLAALWRESFGSDGRGRALAAYACGTGLGHILKKSPFRVWPRAVARASKGVSRQGEPS
jgi:glycosyltransferase involved in cell wall biosynthesis